MQTACPLGRYAAAGSYSCALAPAGKYVSDSTDVTEAAGFGTTIGGDSAEPCPAGSTRAAGLSFCTAESGKYAPVTGNIACSNVGPGFYAVSGDNHAVSSGAVRRASCPCGRYSKVDRATACDKADPGFYAYGADDSDLVGAGNHLYNPDADPPGTGGTWRGAVSQTPALPGTFACTADFAYTGDGSLACHACNCSVGRYTASQPANTNCTNCAEGYSVGERFGLDGSYCVACEKGYFATKLTAEHGMSGL